MCVCVCVCVCVCARAWVCVRAVRANVLLTCYERFSGEYNICPFRWRGVLIKNPDIHPPAVLNTRQTAQAKVKVASLTIIYTIVVGVYYTLHNPLYL